MKYVRFLLVAALLCSVDADARFLRGGGSGGVAPPSGWMSANLGPGGYVIGIDIANDGTKLTWVDTCGGYIYKSGATRWKQYVTSLSLPTVTNDYCNFIYQAAIAHSNSSRLYMVFNPPGAVGKFYRSDNGGDSWALKSNYVVNGQPNQASFNERTGGQKLAVDPQNPDFVISGSPLDGISYSTDGANTWTLIAASSIPLPTLGGLTTGTNSVGSTTVTVDASTPAMSASAELNFAGDPTQYYVSGSYAGGVGTITLAFGATLASTLSAGTHLITGVPHIIAFDPSSATNCGAGSNRTCGIYVFSTGNGVYRSTDGGATWAITTSGPTNVHQMKVSTTGSVFVTDTSGGTLKRFKAGSWSTLLTALGGYHALATDPNNSNRVVLAGGGAILTSINEGVSTTQTATTACPANPGGQQGQLRAATDYPWLAWTNECFMSPGGLAFDPVLPGSTSRLWFTEGIGVWYFDMGGTTTAPSTTITWNSFNLGIDQLVSNQIISSPTAGIIYGSWDRPVFKISSANPPVAPSTHGVLRTPNISLAFSIDYATASTNTIVALAQLSESSGVSQDGGSTWTQFATVPTDGLGGGIAATDASHYVWVGNSNGTVWYTTNSGSTWTNVTGAPFPTPISGETGWGFNYQHDRQIVAADRVTANTVYAYNYGPGAGNGAGVFKSSDSGATWSRVSGNAANTSGKLDPSGDGFNAKMRAVPQSGTTNTAGHLLWTTGPQGSGNSDAGTFQYSVTGGASWTLISVLRGVHAFGFGKNAPGQQYPVIYVAGFLNSGGAGTWGIWKSEDATATWQAVPGQTTGGTAGFPLGIIDQPKTVEGDLNTYGKLYIGYSGSSAIVYQP